VTRPIVFLHGAFCGGWSFDLFRRPFEAAGRLCYAPNLPQHQPGADRAALARLGLRDYAASVAAAISGFEAAPILVGHSMGGLIAQITATIAPVGGLVLLAPSPPWGVAPTTPEEVAAGLALFSFGDYWNQAIDPHFGPARDYSLDRLPAGEQRALFARFVPESGRAAFETLNWGLDPMMAAAAPAERIACPILVLSGGRDALNPASTAGVLVRRFPPAQAEMQVFPAMSHWLVGEPGWEEVAGAALDWLDRRGL
jgi:pimeloyl-ACP methyl ester carboxylesterase